MTDQPHYNLLQHNTFGIEAYCQRFISFSSAEEIQQLFQHQPPAGPYLIIGGGSNLLLTRDFEGTVLHVSIKGIESTCRGDEVYLRCGAGEVWDDVVDYCVGHGFYGAENLSLIPGEVGASAVQNIGAYGSEVKDLIHEVEAIELSTGQLVHFSNADCQYAYRQSRFKNEWRGKYLVTHVTYKLSTVFTPRLDYGNIRAQLASAGIQEPTARQLRDAIISIRQAKLPDVKVLGNAGSFFVNPVVSCHKVEELLMRYPEMPHYVVSPTETKIPAGWLIEQTGWKGRREGRVGVHAHQALVLVNYGGASGQEVLQLCNAIRSSVREKFGIEIHPEVNIV